MAVPGRASAGPISTRLEDCTRSSTWKSRTCAHCPAARTIAGDAGAGGNVGRRRAAPAAGHVVPTRRPRPPVLTSAKMAFNSARLSPPGCHARLSPQNVGHSSEIDRRGGPSSRSGPEIFVDQVSLRRDPGATAAMAWSCALCTPPRSRTSGPRTSDVCQGCPDDADAVGAGHARRPRPRRQAWKKAKYVARRHRRRPLGPANGAVNGMEYLEATTSALARGARQQSASRGRSS